jgi:hypothetical protein
MALRKRIIGKIGDDRQGGITPRFGRSLIHSFAPTRSVDGTPGRFTDGAAVIQPSMTAIASISTIATGSARRLIWTIVLVGVAAPK